MKNKFIPNVDPVKRVSMQSIADVVGVARSTVSFVLNGKEKEGRISEEVAQKVRLTAKKMNYQINGIARSLRTGSTHTIALVIADISDVFFGTLAYHLQEYAESKGYALIIINTGEKKERLQPIFNMLANRQVDGIIMVPVSNIEEGRLEGLNPNIPMVFVDRYFKTLQTSRVIINNYEVSKMAAQLLIGKGCRKIAMISYSESLMHIQDRKQGYIDALSAVNALDRQLICEVGYFGLKSEKIMDFLKEKYTTCGIDGLFLATGGLTSATSRCLLHLGIKLQVDVQLVGFGRIDVVTGVSIPYVKQPMEEICKHSFDILMDQMESRTEKRIDCILPASIVTDRI
ncbi:MAG: LacI family transcriptional regulator [Bacteroidales bacterium]|jgi:LacI family transcriptional regulator|nr:LacI family transcriptional regulator [Bacteroidales bacterium]